MVDSDEDEIGQNESASDFVDRRLIKIARTLENEQHLNFFRSMVRIRQRIDAYVPPRKTGATALRRALGRFLFSARKQQLPPTESRDHPLDHTLMEIIETLQSQRGLDHTESFLLVKQIVDDVVRDTASGIVTKCLTPTTAAWLITNPRLSPLVASPEFVRAGEEVQTGRMPSEQTLDFLCRLADTMLEEGQNT
jgi:hypothetical protein